MLVIAVVLAVPYVITPVASDAKFRVPVAAKPLATAVAAVARYCALGEVESGVAAKA